MEAEMEGVLLRLQSNDNQVRNNAEKQYNAAVKNDVKVALNVLLKLLLAAQNPVTRQQAGVLLQGQMRKKSGERWWRSLQASEKEELKTVLVNRLPVEEVRTVQKQISSVIAKVAEFSLNRKETSEGVQVQDEWQGVLSSLAQICTADPEHAHVAVNAIGDLIQLCPEKADVNSGNAHELGKLLCKLMQGQNTRTSVAAVETASKLCDEVQTLNQGTEGILSQFSYLVTPVLSVCGRVINDEDLWQKWSLAVNDMVYTSAVLFNDESGRQLVVYMLNITCGERTDVVRSEDVRRQAFQVCSTLVEYIPRLIKDDHELIRRMFHISLVFMMEKTEEEDDDDEVEGAAGESSMAETAEYALLCVLESVGTKTALDILFPMIDELLQCKGDANKERVAFEALARAVGTGSKEMFELIPHILGKVLEYITAEDATYQVRVAAFQTLSLILVNFANAEQFGDENSKSVQQLFADPIVAALCKVLEYPRSTDAHKWALCARTALTVWHFCVGFETGAGQQYLQGKIKELIHKLTNLIDISGAIQEQQLKNHGFEFRKGDVDVAEVQGASLLAVASLSRAVGGNFGEYYDQLMPVAKKVFAFQEQAVAEQQKNTQKTREGDKWSQKQITLRGRAMECMAAMGESVGADRFRQDATGLLGSVIQYMQNMWDTGDADRNRQVAEFAKNICLCMGDSVTTDTLKQIFPPILKWAQTPLHSQPGGANGEEDEDEEDEDEDEEEVVRRRMFNFNHYQLELKEEAIQLVEVFSESFGEKLMPWVGEICNVMVEELQAELTSAEIQLNAAYTTVHLLKAVASYLVRDSSTISDDQRAFAQSMFQQSLESCLNSLHCLFEEMTQQDIEFKEAYDLGREIDEDEDENAILIVALAEQVTAILRVAFESGGMSDIDVDKICAIDYNPKTHPPLFCLKPGAIEQVMRHLIQLMQASCSRERGFPWWKETHNNQVMDAISEGIGLLVKTHQEVAVASYINNALPAAMELLEGAQISDALRANGVFLIDDLIEHGGPEAQKLTPKLVPYLIRFSTSPDPVLAQASLFGLGVCAQYGHQHMNQALIQQCAQTLVNAIDKPGSREGDFANSTDNAICSLLKFVIFAKLHDAAPKLIGYLPCVADPLEARTVHFRLLLGMNEPVFAPHTDKIKQILLLAFNERTGFDDKKNSFNQELSILSNQTRKWVAENLVNR
mmetsp:Transcript_34540/g.55140  ORF Transcript_34540/g.55140 Transcript_34540/m.55140 type:complete len:1192 (+) Transcript_34540:66-3641(+)|eukprot:CAMPEP_0203759284 /NCGR_PEP_ID=MMETSP0098-20131031/12224_1 /ASSEMBLY_ACC=CAM_ASM_000208 /TAXON_ID=96639 /ORGANISM=" , Strain NY0313808BC1" /LENGTH=1191 /DNA_ID=CAMNT_0050652103 /DNA_START=33 /DNA_END=3608 /DNA_ORIENTATION=+